MSATTAASTRQYSMVLSEVCPEMMGPAREMVRAHLRFWRKSELSPVAELGVTELLTNVHKHAPGSCELLVRETADGVTVEVTDFDSVLPAVKESTESEENGRGLFLLSVLTEDLRIEPLLGGKRVWFRLRGPSPP
ncbi:ATP-binding protein [Planomonospora sp. ID82291]|uniref:ATP-binding protein n=1 Tax=Planomonospora sp. ID82291 TaxID=2738136 RepID=UPI0018C3E91B|nr:ATP-binding protein [Planomonospora sp. ID82291]MBG0813326.1 ATP-binding protein [Planomonospora sp. ID82291]